MEVKSRLARVFAHEENAPESLQTVNAVHFSRTKWTEQQPHNLGLDLGWVLKVESVQTFGQRDHVVKLKKWNKNAIWILVAFPSPGGARRWHVPSPQTRKILKFSGNFGRNRKTIAPEAPNGTWNPSIERICFIILFSTKNRQFPNRKGHKILKFHPLFFLVRPWLVACCTRKFMK